MSIDLFQLYALIVIFTLFTFGMFFIVAGLKTEESPDDAEPDRGADKNDTV